MAETASSRMTVAEAERLMPDSEYVKCYHRLCETTGRKFDPDMPYGDLPGLFRKTSALAALAVAFADIEAGVDLFSLSKEKVNSSVSKVLSEALA